MLTFDVAVIIIIIAHIHNCTSTHCVPMSCSPECPSSQPASALSALSVPPPLDSILSVAIFSHFHITLPFVCRRLFRCFIYYCSVTSSQMHNETNTLQPKTKK